MLIRSLLLLAALALGLCAGLIDVRSTGIVPVSLVLGVAAFALALIRPANAWLYALLMGLSVPLVHVLAPSLGVTEVSPPHPNVAATLLAIVPALAGALLGIFTRSALVGSPRRIRS